MRGVIDHNLKYFSFSVFTHAVALQAIAYVSAGNATVDESDEMSVCLSVCPSHSGIAFQSSWLSRIVPLTPKFSAQGRYV